MPKFIMYDYFVDEKLQVFLKKLKWLETSMIYEIRLQLGLD